MRDHALRQILNDEVHGRPGLPVSAPARITHLALILDAGDGDPISPIARLCEGWGVRPPKDGALHFTARLCGGLLKFERHGEFYRLSMTLEGANMAGEAISALPHGFVDDLPGTRLVGIHTRILEKDTALPDEAFLQSYFTYGANFDGTHEEPAASMVSQGGALVWTDLHIAANGYTHILVKNFGLSPPRLGRVTRRLHEIETYRMMALLALPLAKSLQADLRQLEERLSRTITDMARVITNDDDTDDAALLSELTVIAQEVEALSNKTSYRFAATRAYANLVDKRVRELGEERVQNFQRLGVFLERRFAPAMSTCDATAHRIADLTARTERASNLLRTRVDITLEAQNQALLRSMDARARQQLLLQEMVEEISVVAISYYSIALLSKFLDGVAPHYPDWPIQDYEWMAVPFVIGFVYLSLKFLHHKLKKAQ